VVNGRLRSMAEDMYDPFILREIYAQDADFLQARVIGSVLGKYSLGIGDEWIAQRMEWMVQEGMLTVVTNAAEDAPLYHRILRRAALPEGRQL